MAFPRHYIHKKISKAEKQQQFTNFKALNEALGILIKKFVHSKNDRSSVELIFKGIFVKAREQQRMLQLKIKLIFNLTMQKCLT